MMSQGRGSAVLAAAMVLCLLIVLHIEVAQAATFTVGDAVGWTFNVVNWPRGKRFSAGDTLIFNYNPSYHNVVTVNKAGYDKCQTPSGAPVRKSGRDQIRLARGQNYFICNFPAHCESSMKIAINAV